MEVVAGAEATTVVDAMVGVTAAVDGAEPGGAAVESEPEELEQAASESAAMATATTGLVRTPRVWQGATAARRHRSPGGLLSPCVSIQRSRLRSCP